MEEDKNPRESERRPTLDQPAEIAGDEPTAPYSAPEDFAAAYARRMHEGEQQYASVLHLLGDMGLPAYFTQTGGMNAAIEVTLESKHYLLVTDIEGSLAWNWAEHQGWAVGLYRHPTDESDTGWQDAIRFAVTDDGSPDALAGVIREMLQHPQPPQGE